MRMLRVEDRLSSIFTLYKKEEERRRRKGRAAYLYHAVSSDLNAMFAETLYISYSSSKMSRRSSCNSTLTYPNDCNDLDLAEMPR